MNCGTQERSGKGSMPEDRIFTLMCTRKDRTKGSDEEILWKSWFGAWKDHSYGRVQVRPRRGTSSDLRKLHDKNDFKHPSVNIILELPDRTRRSGTGLWTFNCTSLGKF